jgi:Carboxypeptidase regulatory-like domain
MLLKPSCLVLAFLLGEICCAQAPAVPPNKDHGDEACTVSGMVIRSQDSAPLKNATVHLANDVDREHRIATKTFADGHFALRNVPPGQYKLRVSRNGYVEQELNQRKPGDPGATFTLRAGQRISDLVFKLARAAVITGKVFDEDGEPMVGVSVRAVRREFSKGRKGFGFASENTTDDLGEFRLFGLAPGRYYISAQLSAWDHIVGDPEFSGSDKNIGEKGYTKVYYPSALEVAKASSIYVKEGEEVPSIDIFMKEVTVYSVRGKVQYLFPHRGTGDTQIMITRRAQNPGWEIVGEQILVKADGSFQIPELAPGEYTVRAYFFDQEKFYSTQEDIDVVNADVDGLTLSLAQGTDIAGHLLWDGKPSLEGERASVYLSSEESDVYGRGGWAHVEENNQFTMKEVSQGTFRIEVNGISKDCYIKEVHFGETSLPDHVLHVKRGLVGPLDVTISSKGARLQGMVTNDESLPVAGVWVVAVPEESKRNLRELFKSVTTDQYGRYDLRGLAPGKYAIFSWDGVEREEWEDPEFLKTNGAKGVAIEVIDSDTKSADLQLLPLKNNTSQAE